MLFSGFGSMGVPAFKKKRKEKGGVGGGFWEVTASVIGQRLRVAIIC